METSEVKKSYSFRPDEPGEIVRANQMMEKHRIKSFNEFLNRAIESYNDYLDKTKPI